MNISLAPRAETQAGAHGAPSAGRALARRVARRIGGHKLSAGLTSLIIRQVRRGTARTGTRPTSRKRQSGCQDEDLRDGQVSRDRTHWHLFSSALDLRFSRGGAIACSRYRLPESDPQDGSVRRSAQLCDSHPPFLLICVCRAQSCLCSPFGHLSAFFHADAAAQRVGALTNLEIPALSFESSTHREAGPYTWVHARDTCWDTFAGVESRTLLPHGLEHAQPHGQQHPQANQSPWRRPSGHSSIEQFKRPRKAYPATG